MRMLGLVVAVMALALAGCASSETLVQHVTEARAKSRNPEYLQGFSDGCSSGYARSSFVVRASYTRDEARFRQSREYAAGWDDGRLECNYPDGSPTFLLHP